MADRQILDQLLMSGQFASQGDSRYIKLDGTNGPLTGPLGLAVGSAAAPSLYGDSFITTGFYFPSSTSIAISISGVQGYLFGAAGLTQTLPGGGNSQIIVLGEGTTNIVTSRYSSEATGAENLLRKSRGTIASPTVPITSDFIGDFTCQVQNGSGFTRSARIRGQCIETSTVDSTHAGSQWIVQNCPIGSATLTEVLKTNTANGLQMTLQISLSKTRVVPVTGFNNTIADGKNLYHMKPAGTLATGTLTMPAAPSDGQEVTIATTQTITAFTLNANSGQTINNAPTTLLANTACKFFYDSTGAAWVREF